MSTTFRRRAQNVSKSLVLYTMCTILYCAKHLVLKVNLEIIIISKVNDLIIVSKVERDAKIDRKTQRAVAREHFNRIVVGKRRVKYNFSLFDVRSAPMKLFRFQRLSVFFYVEFFLISFFYKCGVIINISRDRCRDRRLVLDTLVNRDFRPYLQPVRLLSFYGPITRLSSICTVVEVCCPDGESLGVPQVPDHWVEDRSAIPSAVARWQQ